MGCPCMAKNKDWAHVFPDGVNTFRTEVEAKASFYRMGSVGAVMPSEQVNDYIASLQAAPAQ